MKNDLYRVGFAILTVAMLLSSCAVNAPAQSDRESQGTPDTTQGDSICTEPYKPNIPNADDFGYVLVFSDEFDGTSLNSEHWKYRTDEKAGGVNQRSNVSVHDGRLYIKFDREDGKYTGGGIISKELFGYGFYETKCTLFAEGGGLHSSFWLMGGARSGDT